MGSNSFRDNADPPICHSGVEGGFRLCCKTSDWREPPSKTYGVQTGSRKLCDVALGMHKIGAHSAYVQARAFSVGAHLQAMHQHAMR